VRSSLVPGAGQKALGHANRGNLFLLGVGVLGAASLVAHERFLDARRDQRDLQRRYDMAESEDEISRRSDELARASDHAGDMSSLRWGMLAAAGGVYVWNIVDAAGLARGAAQPGPMSVTLRSANSGLRVGIAWRIS
jgi:hypothetical protein